MRRLHRLAPVALFVSLLASHATAAPKKPVPSPKPPSANAVPQAPVAPSTSDLGPSVRPELAPALSREAVATILGVDVSALERTIDLGPRVVYKNRRTYLELAGEVAVQPGLETPVITMGKLAYAVLRFRAAAHRSYLIDCRVDGAGLYQTGLRVGDVLDRYDRTTSDGHLKYTIDPASTVRDVTLTLDADNRYGWNLYGCRITPAR